MPEDRRVYLQLLAFNSPLSQQPASQPHRLRKLASLTPHHRSLDPPRQLRPAPDHEAKKRNQITSHQWRSLNNTGSSCGRAMRANAVPEQLPVEGGGGEEASVLLGAPDQVGDDLLHRPVRQVLADLEPGVAEAQRQPVRHAHQLRELQVAVALGDPQLQRLRRRELAYGRRKRFRELDRRCSTGRVCVARRKTELGFLPDSMLWVASMTEAEPRRTRSRRKAAQPL